MAASDPPDAHRDGRLRLVDGGAGSRPRIRGAPPSRQPFAVEALILEEDTWFALSAPPEVSEPSLHPLRTLTEAWEAEPAAPGSIAVRPGDPLRILAVVHDLSLEPTWRAEWIEAALRRGLAEVRRRGLTSVGVEPLGAVHGRFPASSFDALLAKVLQTEGDRLKAVWRIEAEDTDPAM